MLGMEKLLINMLENMGVNPEEIFKQVGQAVNLLIELNNRLERIEHALGIEAEKTAIVPDAQLIEGVIEHVRTGTGN